MSDQPKAKPYNYKGERKSVLLRVPIDLMETIDAYRAGPRWERQDAILNLIRFGLDESGYRSEPTVSEADRAALRDVASGKAFER